MIAQIFIAVFGVLAIWFTQQANQDRKKYACIFGLIAQPFWFYATWQSQQWGMFALCYAYTGAWLIGVYNYWVAKSQPQPPAEPELKRPVRIGNANYHPSATLAQVVAAAERNYDEWRKSGNGKNISWMPEGFDRCDCGNLRPRCEVKCFRCLYDHPMFSICSETNKVEMVGVHDEKNHAT